MPIRSLFVFPTSDDDRAVIVISSAPEGQKHLDHEVGAVIPASVAAELVTAAGGRPIQLLTAPPSRLAEAQAAAAVRGLTIPDKPHQLVYTDDLPANMQGWVAQWEATALAGLDDPAYDPE